MEAAVRERGRAEGEGDGVLFEQDSHLGSVFDPRGQYGGKVGLILVGAA